MEVNGHQNYSLKYLTEIHSTSTKRKYCLTEVTAAAFTRFSFGLSPEEIDGAEVSNIRRLFLNGHLGKDMEKHDLSCGKQHVMSGELHH